jgi:ribosomal subunit interface protein
MTLAWKLVSKHVHPHAQLQSIIRRKIAKIESHLQHFPPDTVHLLVSMERHVKRDAYEVEITLRLPSNILHSHKEAKGDPIKAFDNAIRALLRELEAFKTQLRREASWHRQKPGAKPARKRLARFATKPQTTGPSTLADTLATMISRYHGRLLYHVQGQLRRDQENDDVPRGAIKPEVVVDEVVRTALAHPGNKPPELSYRLWLFTLAQRELHRRYRRIRLDGERNIPIEEEATVPDEEGLVEGYDAERPLEIIEEKLEPAVVTRADLLRDEHAFPPDAIAAEHDLIDYLHQVTSRWPEKERAVFDLHFLEGFDAQEVALLENLRPQAAEEAIANVQARLRGVLMGATEQWVEAKRLSGAARQAVS